MSRFVTSAMGRRSTTKPSKFGGICPRAGSRLCQPSHRQETKGAGRAVYCIRMSRPKTDSAVLTLRVPAKVHRYLTREARRRRQTRSDIARNILQERVEGSSEPDFLLEARRQSLLVSKRRSERDILAFLDAVADRRGWK